MSGIIQSLFGGAKSDQAAQQQSTSASTQGGVQNSANQSTAVSGNTSQSSGSSSGSSTTSDYTNPALSGLGGNLADTLKQVLASFSTQTANAGNPLANAQAAPQAAVTSPEQQLLDQIMKMSGSGNPTSSYLDKAVGGNFLPGQPGANPFLDAAIKAAQRPTLQGLEETLTRSLPGRFTANGQMIQSNAGDQGGSSAFDRAGAIATRGVADAVGDIATKMSSDAYGSERQLQQGAAGLDQAQVDQTIKGLQAVALPRLIQQNGLDKGLQLFQQQTANLLDFLKTIGTVQAPTLAANSISSSTQSGTSTGSSVGQSSGTSSGVSYGQSTSQSTGSSVGSSTTDKGIIPGVSGLISSVFKPV